MPLVERGFFTRFLSIPPEATDFAARGFRLGDPSTRQQLELSASTFVRGYHIALASSSNATLAKQLEQIDQSFRGFAYEGAAMALALLDFFFPWQKRFQAFTQQEGKQHIYMLYVGWGWTMGRLPLRRMQTGKRSSYDPLLAWLAYDGYGFHEGFFAWKQRLLQQRWPASLPTGYARRAFDQGLGRSLWFVSCGDIAYLRACIHSFPLSRQPDLWSGIGLACAYAGGVSVASIQQLCDVSTPFHEHLAQGVAFAVKARQRAGNLGTHTQLACELLCQRSTDEIVSIVDFALNDLSSDGEEPAFGVWRRRIQDALRVSVTSA